MKRAGAHAGWVLAIILAVVAGILYVSNQRLSNEIEGLRNEMAALRHTIDRLVAVEKKDEAPKDSEVKPAEEAAKPTPAVANSTSPAEPVQAPMNLAAMFGKLAKAAVAAKPGDTKDKDGGGDGEAMSGLAEMFSGEKGKEMRDYSAGMAVNMQYGDLFTSLHLAPDVEQRVRDILKDSLAEEIGKGLDAMHGKANPGDMKKMKDDAEAQTRAKLSELLSPAEMATYDEYQTTLPRRTLTQAFDMQLNMFAPGLTPENHARTLDVLVEEMLPGETAQHNAGMRDPTAAMGNQQEAFSRARDRLAQEFDEAQLANVDRFFSQMQQMAVMSSRMMEVMRKPDAKPQ